MDTIFALSSGRPPAAIAIVRVSGPAAMTAAAAIAGALPEPRIAALRTLRTADGTPLDRALVLVFPGPTTATGEDLVELHLHGGRAVVAAVEAALALTPGLRRALPGEFTRRSLENGRIDVAQAQGLADLLEAETEVQRRAAFAASEGAIGRMVHTWIGRIGDLSARIEAELDFADEGDVVGTKTDDLDAAIGTLADEIDAILARPTVERLGDGFRVVLAGPRNAGKSSLFNALLERDAAIVTPIAGTTRDLLEASVVRGGIPYRIVDTAGLIEETDDEVERIGIERAARAMQQADVVLWLGDPALLGPRGIPIHAKCDIRPDGPAGSISVAASRPETVTVLWGEIERHAATLTISTDDIALHEAQRATVAQCRHELVDARDTTDPIVRAEHLRVALRSLGQLVGIDATEAMLDALFARFCLGK